MSKVSVVVPTHNRAKLIQQAIDSVVMQTYSDWELLIVDDFSTDGTEVIVNTLISKYANTKIKYIKNEAKKGVSGARNTGIKHAQGRYIAFLDSDDLWDKNNLKLKIKTLKSNLNIDAILSDSHVFGEIEERYIRAPHTAGIFDDKFWDRHDRLLAIAQNSITPFLIKYGFHFRMPTLIFNKELLSKVGFFNENMTYYEDAEFIFRFFCAGKVGYLHKKLCHIRRHSFNTDNIYSKNAKLESKVLLTKSMTEYAAKFNLGINKAFLKRVLRDAYIHRATSWFRDGQPKEARKCILKSIKTKFCIKALMRLFGLYVFYFLPNNIKNILLRQLKLAT